MSFKSIEDLRRSTQEITQRFNLAEIREFAGMGRTKVHGRTVVRSLLAVDLVGVVDVTMPAGETFPRHDHDMIETFHLYRGRLDIEFDDGTHRRIDAGRSLSIESHEAHVVRAVEDCDMICVTMPRDFAYPN